MIIPDPEAPSADLVKVLDFGIAKILERDRESAHEGGSPDSSAGPQSDAPPSSALTMVGALVGTPEYMSPEQSMGTPVDARSDVYACGVLLFYLVTGRLPFSGSPIEVMMQQADKPPPAPSTFQPGLHVGLERVILKALAKVPEARQQSAAELSEALSALLPELATTSRRAAVTGASSDRGAALLSVPSAVVINAPPRSSEPPPETLRSPPPPPDAEAPQVILGAAAGREVAKTPPTGMARTPSNVFEKTVAVVPAAPPVTAQATPVVAVAEPAERAPVAPVTAVAEKPAAAPDGAAVAAEPPREEPARAVAPRPEPLAPVGVAAIAARREDDDWIARPWVLALTVAIGSVLIWLVRYLRFESSVGDGSAGGAPWGGHDLWSTLCA